MNSSDKQIEKFATEACEIKFCGYNECGELISIDFDVWLKAWREVMSENCDGSSVSPDMK